MLAVCLVQWERCCPEWLLSELFLVWFCSFIQQIADKNSTSLAGSRIAVTGQMLLSRRCAKNRTLASSFEECSPCRRQHFRNVLQWIVYLLTGLGFPALRILAAVNLTLLQTKISFANSGFGDRLWGWGLCMPHVTTLNFFHLSKT